MSDKMGLYNALVAAKLNGGGGSGGFTPTAAQLAAMNSGIDSTKVGQITTSKAVTDCITIDSDINLFVSATEPTGDIPLGSTWINGGTIKVYVESDNLIDQSDVELVQVTDQGTERCGTEIGILSQGTYTLNATKAAGAVNVYMTTETSGTYASSEVSELPYTFNADGSTKYILRTADAQVKEWSTNGYTNLMLNTGSSALSFEPYGNIWK